MTIKRNIEVCIIGVLLVLVSCTKAAPVPTPGPNEVWYQYGEFYPNVITVPVGTTVTWINKDSRLHTVTSDTGLFGGTIDPSSSFKYVFSENGTFTYYDDYDAAHREIGGVVYVK